MQELRKEIQRLRREDPDKLAELFTHLTDEEAHALVYDPDLWLRDNQVVKDEWPEPIIMMMAGRGCEPLQRETAVE